MSQTTTTTERRSVSSETYALTFHGPTGLASFFNCLLALGWFWTDRDAPLDHIQTPLTAWLAWETGLAPSALYVDEFDQERVRYSVFVGRRPGCGEHQRLEIVP